MMTSGAFNRPFAAAARLLLGALGFLLLASYLAIPCFVNDRAVFASGDGPVSCSESHVFRPHVPLPDVFEVSMPTHDFRLSLPAMLFAAVTAFSLTLAPRIRDALRRARRAGPLADNVRALPFAPRGDTPAIA